MSKIVFQLLHLPLSSDYLSLSVAEKYRMFQDY